MSCNEGKTEREAVSINGKEKNEQVSHQYVRYRLEIISPTLFYSKVIVDTEIQMTEKRNKREKM